MAKTITAMLVGIAVDENAIESIDDPVCRYVPELTGTEYGATTLRALLHMSSGVEFREDYGGDDDIARFNRALFGRDTKGPAAAIALFNTRASAPDTKFHYASVET